MSVLVVKYLAERVDILAGFRNTGRDTTDPPPPLDNNAGDSDDGEPVTEDDELDTRHACMKHVVDSVNRFRSSVLKPFACFARMDRCYT